MRKYLILLALSGASVTAFAKDIVFQLDTGIPGQKVFLASDLNDWDATATPMPEVAPGSYQLAIEEPWLHEIQYKFVVDGQWMSDPSNPQASDDGHGGRNSVLQTDFQEDPLLDPRPGRHAWEQTELHLTDREGADRVIYVMSPPPRYPKTNGVTVYFQDGGDYLDKTGAVHMLENLSSEPAFPVMTGVFIPPKDRMREYELLDAYSDWVSLDVVPAIEARWHTGGSRFKRLLIGPSLGGLITAYTALKHPDVFGNAASQSGSFWYGPDAILPFLTAASGTGLKLYMDVGTYEGDEMLGCNHRAHQTALGAGLDVDYQEYPSTHDWIGWRNRLQQIFRHFFGNTGS